MAECAYEGRFVNMWHMYLIETIKHKKSFMSNKIFQKNC